MAYSFDQVFAADPANPANIARNAAITIFAPGDGTMTPLTLTDTSGGALSNPVQVNTNGFGSAFQHATLDRVAWAGGGFTGFFTSYEGMKNEAIAAREAAEAAESAAATAGTDAAAVAAAALADATAAAESAAASAATSAALVGAPADTIIAAAINSTGTATKAALDVTIAGTINQSITDAIAADSTVVNAAATAVDAYLIENPIEAPASGPVVVWKGDSLSAQGGSAGQNPAGYLATYTGQTVLTDAVGGETATGIAARTGAMPYLITPAGGTIPASGGVTVTLATPTGYTAYPLLQTNGNPALGQTLVGSIKLPGGAYVRGTITLTQPTGPSTSHRPDDYYTFTRATSGTAVTISRPAPFYTDFAETHRDAITVIQYGRNDMPISAETDITVPVNRVLEAVAAEVEYMEAANKRYIILGVHNGTGEASGTLTYQKVIALNKALRATYGRRFVDFRPYLIAYGLTDAGITPTAEDTTAIAEDRVPPSLLTDGLHLQLATRNIIAKLVGDREYELGWISVVDTTPPTAPTGLTASNLGATSFTLTWTGSTDNLAVAGYDVYLDGVLKTSVTSTTASITGVTGGTTYSVTVKAKDDAGNVSAASTALPVTTQTLITDNFNRADSTDLGPNWTSNALFKIASNKLTRAATSSTIGLLTLATQMSTANHKASVVINRGTASTSGLVVRRLDDSNFYAVRVNQTLNNILLYKVIGGVTTSLSGLDNQWTDGSTLSLEVIGNNLKAYINGVQILSVTNASDAALASAKGVGIRGNADGATLPTYDDFTAEAFA